MNWLIKKILRTVGWQKLLNMTWNAIHEFLEEKAKSTETEFDDKALAILDEIVGGLISEA